MVSLFSNALYFKKKTKDVKDSENSKNSCFFLECELEFLTENLGEKQKIITKCNKDIDIKYFRVSWPLI